MFSKTVKAIAAGAILLGAVEANAAAANAKPLRVGPVQVHGVLETSGNKIVGKKSGKEAMIRGMSLFWSDATGLQYYNKEVIKWAVENLKIDVFRYAMGIRYYDSQGGTSGEMDANYSYYGSPDLQKNKIDQMVEAAIENDIYIIIDWHSHRANNETSDAKKFFGEMAEKYKNVPNIIWEVFNEPVKQSTSDIASYANSVISEIRKNSDNLALVGTPNWSQMGSGSCGTVNLKNVGYVFHFYAATHSLNSFKGNIDGCRQNNAVFITEWGTTDANGTGSTNTSAASEWETYMEQNKISNCNWSLRNEESTIGEKTKEASAMFSGDQFLTTQAALAGAGYTTSGSHVKGYLTKNATDWAGQFASTLKSGSCSFTAVSVKESAGSIANSLKSGCTYTSSDESVVTSAGAVVSAGFAIMTGNDGSQSLVSVIAEPKQSIAGWGDFRCTLSGSCTKSKTIKDLDGDGKNEVLAPTSGKTEQGATLTLKALNPEIVKIKTAKCSNKSGCFGSTLNATVQMYEFSGTLGEGKIVATAPVVSGYIALNDTITISYAKAGDKIDEKTYTFKDMTVEKGTAVANVFAPTTYYDKTPITYTFDGQPLSAYLSNVDGHLVAGNEDAIVTIVATAPETEMRAAFEQTIRVIIGDSATAANKGNVAIPTIAKAQGKFSAQFAHGGLFLDATQGGRTSIDVISVLGQVTKTLQANISAGHNWIPMTDMSAGKYIIRVRQGSFSQVLRVEIK